MKSKFGIFRNGWRMLARRAGHFGPTACSRHTTIDAWQDRQPNTKSRTRIPTGFRPRAQGCEERATLGMRRRSVPTPKGLRRALLLTLVSLPIFAQQPIDITVIGGEGWPKPIPVSISGFTGEVDSVLKTDLIFMGIQNVSPDQAKYLISGNNASRVEGRVVERVNKNSILAKAYTGGSLRSQTHALADD